MDLARLWSILNQPLSVALFNLVLATLFVKLVWEPYVERSKAAARRATIRDEVAFRLDFMEPRFATHDLWGNVEGGLSAAALDPSFKPWSLLGLIYGGWARERSEQCSPYIERLRVSEAERGDPQIVTKAADGVRHIRSILSGTSAKGAQQTWR